MGGYVYIMASKKYGTIYVGVTSDLQSRAWQHKEGILPGFTKRYRVHDLVWFELHDTIEAAIQREHNMKLWPRRWKTRLVDDMNPDWDDLYPTLIWRCDPGWVAGSSPAMTDIIIARRY
jgi:putative endonuclease